MPSNVILVCRGLPRLIRQSQMPKKNGVWRSYCELIGTKAVVKYYISTLGGGTGVRILMSGPKSGSPLMLFESFFQAKFEPGLRLDPTFGFREKISLIFSE